MDQSIGSNKIKTMTNNEKDDVNYNNVESADPREIDKSSSEYT